MLLVPEVMAQTLDRYLLGVGQFAHVLPQYVQHLDTLVEREGFRVVLGLSESL